MPVYEYECPTHGRYEVTQRITEAALTKCSIEACDQPIRKLISNTSFALKGGGWYQTDYGGRSATTASEAKTETKTESKPEAKTESAGGCGAAACGAGACAPKVAQA